MPNDNPISLGDYKKELIHIGGERQGKTELNRKLVEFQVKVKSFSIKELQEEYNSIRRELRDVPMSTKPFRELLGQLTLLKLYYKKKTHEARGLRTDEVFVDESKEVVIKLLPKLRSTCKVIGSGKPINPRRKGKGRHRKETKYF